MIEAQAYRLGSHLSIAKGLNKSAAMAREINANTFQFFTRNPRGGAARSIGEIEIKRWHEVRKELDLFPIVGHLPYTVNLAAPKEETWEFAVRVLAEDLERMNAIGAEFLVVHPGSHGGQGADKGRQRILASLAQSFLPFAGESQLLLEAMAGQGSEVGSLQDLEYFLQELDHPPNLGICLDTCHLFAAGYDLRQREGLESLLEEVNERFGLEKIKVIHLNDSNTQLGSRKDRHARLGQGYLGKEGIVNVLTHPNLSHLPFLLETPVSNYQEYGEEIDLIREWLEEV